MNDEATDVLARVKLALGVSSLPELADALGESLGAVKSWSARGSVPLPALVRAAERSGSTLDWLVRGVGTQHASDRKPQYASGAAAAHGVPQESGGEQPPVQPGGPYSRRVATAIRIVNAGLDAEGVDGDLVPRAEMAGAVFELLPWPIPWKDPAKQ